jgi:hypothetical protein
MADQQNDKKNKDENKDPNIKDAPVKPEPETLHTTDPQKKMEGPVSSLMHGAGKTFDTDESKEEADRKKEKEDSE